MDESFLPFTLMHSLGYDEYGRVSMFPISWLKTLHKLYAYAFRVVGWWWRREWCFTMERLHLVNDTLFLNSSDWWYFFYGRSFIQFGHNYDDIATGFGYGADAYARCRLYSITNSKRKQTINAFDWFQVILKLLTCLRLNVLVIDILWPLNATDTIDANTIFNFVWNFNYNPSPNNYRLYSAVHYRDI